MVRVSGVDTLPLLRVAPVSVAWVPAWVTTTLYCPGTVASVDW